MSNFFLMEEFNNLFFEKKKLDTLNLGLKLNQACRIFENNNKSLYFKNHSETRLNPI